MHVQIEIDLNSVSLFLFFFFLCRSAISITGEWAKTLSGDPFLFRADGNADKMLVFGTSENLSKLADLDTIYVDETFTTSHLFTANSLPSMGLSMASNSPWYTAFYLPKAEPTTIASLLL